MSHPTTLYRTNLHSYHAVIRDDDSFTIKLDNNVLTSGSLSSEDDFVNGVNPAKIIDDPEDAKPEDWVDEPMVWYGMVWYGIV